MSKRPVVSLKLEFAAAQLESLLVLSCGAGREAFEDIGPLHRDNIIGLASDLAGVINREINGAGGEE